MWLIGQEWKCSNVWSGLILIGRGLDLNELGKVSRISIASSYCSVLKVQPSFLREEKKAKEASLPAAAGTGVGAFDVYAPLAQLVEQLTLNQWVLGSSPRWCTTSFFV